MCCLIAALCPSTIISNPHATLGAKQNGTTQPQPMLSPNGKSPYVNVEVGGYHPPEFSHGRSANGTHENWLKVTLYMSTTYVCCRKSNVKHTMLYSGLAKYRHL